mgnify:FL=1
MITKYLEHAVSSDLNTSVAELLLKHPMEFSTSKTRLLLALPPDKGDDETLINSSPGSPSPLLVIILACHRHLMAQTLQTYSSSTPGLFPRPVGAFPTFFFLNESASVPVRSHKISKNDSDNA